LPFFQQGCIELIRSEKKYIFQINAILAICYSCYKKQQFLIVSQADGKPKLKHKRTEHSGDFL